MNGGAVLRGAGIVGALAALVLAAACARQGTPPGGPEDRRPPVVASVSPEPFSFVEPGTAAEMSVVFSERISERPQAGTLRDAVTISPRTGDIQVDHDREGIEIILRGGYRPNTVYRVTIAPVLQDMFSNPMAVPFEWVFSTGPEFEANALVGLAFDRITGDPVNVATLLARPIVDGVEDTTITHLAQVDEEGIFAFRYLPRGAYRVTAFLDRNRDGRVDPSEPFGGSAVTLGAGEQADTAQLLIPVLEPDSTPATLVSAEVVDSVTLRVRFDDRLDPAQDLAGITSRLVVDTAAVDSLLAAGDTTGVAGRVAEARGDPLIPTAALHPWRWEEVRDSLQALADSLAAAEAQAAAVPDSLAADSVGPPAAQDPAAPAAGAVAAGAQTADEEVDLLPDGSRPPAQEIILRFARPIPVSVPLRLVIEGVRNVNGLDGGGGDASVVRTLPPPPEPPPAADSLAAPAGAAIDTGAVADTGMVADTGAVADTGSVANGGSVAGRPRRR